MIEKIIAFIIGSCVGSFLNVCIHRLPKELSIVKPSSFCPKCNKPIKWHDNIPILSYFLLGAKCRNCREKISFRYVFVEIITALLFLFLFNEYGASVNFFKFAFFFSFLILVSFIDIDYHAIPAYLCFIGIVVGLLLSIYDTQKVLKFGFTTNLPIIRTLKNLIFSFGFVYLFKFFGDIGLSLYLSLRKKESIEGETESLGLGDVDFMGVVGVFLGWNLCLVTFFVAPFIALIYSVYAFIFKKSHLIPYLPYLSLAAVVSYLWGNNILRLLGF